MEKYYLISIQYINDGTNPCAIFAYDLREEALGSYHATLASNYNNPNLDGFLCMVIDDTGVIIRTEKWEKPIE